MSTITGSIHAQNNGGSWHFQRRSTAYVDELTRLILRAAGEFVELAAHDFHAGHSSSASGASLS